MAFADEVRHAMNQAREEEAARKIAEEMTAEAAIKAHLEEVCEFALGFIRERILDAAERGEDRLVWGMTVFGIVPVRWLYESFTGYHGMPAAYEEIGAFAYSKGVDLDCVKDAVDAYVVRELEADGFEVSPETISWKEQ